MLKEFEGVEGEIEVGEGIRRWRSENRGCSRENRGWCSRNQGWRMNLWMVKAKLRVVKEFEGAEGI